MTDAHIVAANLVIFTFSATVDASAFEADAFTADDTGATSVSVTQNSLNSLQVVFDLTVNADTIWNLVTTAAGVLSPQSGLLHS